MSIAQHAWLVDIGVARNLLGGVVAFSAQNLGRSVTDDPAVLTTPQQFLAGYSITRPAGPLDVGLYGQVTMRPDWIAPAGGAEIGLQLDRGLFGHVAGRRKAAGNGRRNTRSPLGAAFTADRLTIEYGVQFIEGGRASHGVTVRWR